MKSLSKSYYFYPTIVVVLILVTMVGSLSMLFITKWDGGAQIVENYYQKTLDWNETAEALEKSKALGWQMMPQIKSSNGGNTQTVTITLQDAQGNPIQNAQGKLIATRPSNASLKIETPFVATTNGYQATLTVPLLGYWDLSFIIQKGKDVFLHQTRIHTHL